MTKVSVIKVNDYYNIKDEIIEAFNQHGGIKSLFKENDNILIKPNLLAPQKYENDPVITNPKLILALAELLTEHKLKVSIGDSPAWSTPSNILKKAGIYEKLIKINAQVINLNEANHPLKTYTQDRKLIKYKIINLPKLKVHSQLGLSLSIKNLFGCISGKRKAMLHFIHGDKKNVFAEMLIRNYKDVNPTFTILDGITVMNENGPIWGKAKNLNLLFAGTDCVAIDRVIEKCVNYPKEYRITQAAAKLGVGETDINNINIIGSIPSLELQYPVPMPISFSPFRVAKSIIKNIIANKKRKTA